MPSLKPENIFVIVGPTASGKSDYAIALAHEIGGEIVSADSRQVYRGMDIGTGKIPKDFPVQSESEKSKVESRERNFYFSGGIRHHLLDVASPKRTYTVTHFLRDAKAAIADIERRGKIPIICGGTNFWIEALVFDTEFPEVKPDIALRKELTRLTEPELFTLLREKDPDRAETIDRHNKVRLIRALEIVATLGKVPKSDNNRRITDNQERVSLCSENISPPSPRGFPSSENRGGPKVFNIFPWIATPEDGLAKTDHCKNLSVNSEMRKVNSDLNYHFIGIDPPKEILRERIQKRLKKRLDEGMVEEVRRLHETEGLSWKRLENFGLEYRWCARFLQGKITHEEMAAGILKDSLAYAKRQMTFLRRLERKRIRIEWIRENS